MVEQPVPGEAQHDAVLIAGSDDVVVPNGAAGLCNVAYPGLPCPLHVVPKGEECVGAAGNAGLLGDPCLLFLLRYFPVQ